MEENRSVSEHVLRMSGYSNRLAEMGIALLPEAIIDRVLQSLPPSYKGFVLTYSWKYALEAIINWLLLYFLVRDNRSLSMLELY